MTPGFITCTQLTPPREEQYFIHARLIDHATNETLLTVDLAGMPKEAVDRTKRFCNRFSETSNGTYHLQVWAEESISQKQIFSKALSSLPNSVSTDTWDFFDALEERF